MAAEHLRVFNFYYRQEWSDGRFALKLGQLALDDDFMGSECSCLFAHSPLGAMPTQVATPLSARHDNNSAYPVYAVAAPGVWFSARASDKLSLQAGLYHGGPGPDAAANHGFDYDSGVGPVLFYEGSYQLSIGGRASTLRAGGAVHFGRFDDYAALNAGADVATVRGIHSFYAIQDLVLLAADADHSKLSAFWRAGLSPQQDRSVVHRYADAGLNWFAPLPGRADDIAGIAISYTEYGREFRRSDVALAAAETALELTYRAQVTKSFALQGIAQRHFNPAPREDGHRHPASVLGLRAEWSY
jgi:porin